jgi:cyanate lyase
MDHRRLHGQMTFSAEEAAAIGKLLELPTEAVVQLQVVPYKGSLPTAVPTDPLIYRFYELINVYGTTIKSLIHEEFGDGIMSAIDFSMDIQRVEDPKGDRVNIVLNGKFLPYKSSVWPGKRSWKSRSLSSLSALPSAIRRSPSWTFRSPWAIMSRPSALVFSPRVTMAFPLFHCRPNSRVSLACEIIC